MRRLLYGLTGSLLAAAYIAFIFALMTARIDDGSRWVGVGFLTALGATVSWVAAYNAREERRF